MPHGFQTVLKQNIHLPRDHQARRALSGTSFFTVWSGATIRLGDTAGSELSTVWCLTLRVILALSITIVICSVADWPDLSRIISWRKDCRDLFIVLAQTYGCVCVCVCVRVCVVCVRRVRLSCVYVLQGWKGKKSEKRNTLDPKVMAITCLPLLEFSEYLYLC